MVKKPLFRDNDLVENYPGKPIDLMSARLSIDLDELVESLPMKEGKRLAQIIKSSSKKINGVHSLLTYPFYWLRNFVFPIGTRSFSDFVVEMYGEETSFDFDSEQVVHFPSQKNSIRDPLELLVLNTIINQRDQGNKNIGIAVPQPNWPGIWETFLGYELGAYKPLPFSARTEDEYVRNFKKLAQKGEVSVHIIPGQMKPGMWSLSPRALELLDEVHKEHNIVPIVDEYSRSIQYIPEKRESLASFLDNPAVIFHTAKLFGHNHLINSAGAILPQNHKNIAFHNLPDVVDRVYGDALHGLWLYGAQAIREQVKQRNEKLDDLLNEAGVDSNDIIRYSDSHPNTSIRLGDYRPRNIDPEVFFSAIEKTHGVSTVPAEGFYHPSFLAIQRGMTGRRKPFKLPELVRLTVADPKVYEEGARRFAEAIKFYKQFK